MSLSTAVKEEYSRFLSFACKNPKVVVSSPALLAQETLDNTWMAAALDAFCQVLQQRRSREGRTDLYGVY